MSYRDQQSGWCVLRMSGPATLGVVEALREVGLEAWTPAQEVLRRVGRARVPTAIPAPLLPSFAFARYNRVAELAAFSTSRAQMFQVWDSAARRMVAKGCPHFSLMRHAGQYISISDRALDALRVAEQRRVPVSKVQLLEPGEQVRCPDAGFDGLTGIVQTTKGRRALVLFDGLTIPINILADRLLRA